MEPTGLLPWVSAEDLLLLQLLAAEDSRVEELWQRWQGSVDLDDLPWSSVRLAAAAIGRLGRLGRQQEFGPRLIGVRRYCWSNGQHKIAAAAPVLDALAQAAIPTLLLKGGAALATGDARPGERYIADIDLLVPPERCDETLDILARQGWRPQSGGRIARVKGREMARHHAVNLVDAGQGEIDLHWCLLKENRAEGDDAPVWAKAQSVTLAGRPLLVPAPHHRLLQALAQGVQWSSGNALDWAADSIQLLRRPDLDLGAFVAEVAARSLDAQVGMALRFLAEEVGLELAGPAARLSATVPASPWREELAAGRLPTAERGAEARRALVEAAGERAARARKAGRPSLFAERRREARLALPAVRRLFLRRGVRLELEALPGGRTRLSLPAAASGTECRDLYLALAAPRDMAGPCRIEVGSESAWVGRWRLPRGRVRWRAARLSEAALAALAEEGLIVEPFEEMRRIEGTGRLEPRSDGPVRVLKAVLKQ